MTGSVATASSIVRARDNPFRVERVLTFRYRLDGLTWDELIARWEALGRRGAIVGPKGAGKTTLLEDLAARFRESGQSVVSMRLSSDERRDAARMVDQCLATAAAGDLVFIDGAEQLGGWAWRRLRRRSERCAGMIITTHQPGRLPTLIECRSSVARLEEIVATLTPERYDALQPRLPGLFADCDGNLRLCLRRLYDTVAASG